jgi:hypothetical protein
VDVFVQALQCALSGLVEEKEEVSIQERAVSLAHDYLEKFMGEHAHYLSSAFMQEALDMLENVSIINTHLCSASFRGGRWGSACLGFAPLETLIKRPYQ